MSHYVKLFTNFYSHRKTARLRAAIGNDALWIMPRLWAYAAENQPDGILEDFTAEELALHLAYNGDAQAMLQAMLQAGFLDKNPLKIHGWEEHNSYHSAYSERAKKAAAARWGKSPPPIPPTPREEKIREDKTREETSIASSIPASRKAGPGRRPKSIDECVTKGKFIGLSESDARQWFTDCEAVDWRRGDGTPFDNWARQMVLHRDQKRAADSKNNIPIFKRQEILDKAILDHPCNRDSLKYTANPTKSQKEEYQELLEKRKALFAKALNLTKTQT